MPVIKFSPIVRQIVKALSKEDVKAVLNPKRRGSILDELLSKSETASGSKIIEPKHLPYEDVVKKASIGKGDYKIGERYWWEHPDSRFKEYSHEVIVGGEPTEGKVPTYLYLKDGKGTTFPELTPVDQLQSLFRKMKVVK